MYFSFGGFVLAVAVDSGVADGAGVVARGFATTSRTDLLAGLAIPVTDLRTTAFPRG